MPNLPDLTTLSHAQKDELIRLLWPLQQQVQDLMAQMGAMQDRIKQLEGRLALNSKNSSKPPSSDGMNKPVPKSLRIPGQNPNGGQKGHTGNTLRKAAQPDKIVIHDVPEHCPACHAKLNFASVAETRQVFDCGRSSNMKSPNTTSCSPSARVVRCIPGNFLPRSAPQCSMAHAHRLPWCTSIKTMRYQYNVPPR